MWYDSITVKCALYTIARAYYSTLVGHGLFIYIYIYIYIYIFFLFYFYFKLIAPTLLAGFTPRRGAALPRFSENPGTSCCVTLQIQTGDQTIVHVVAGMCGMNKLCATCVFEMQTMCTLKWSMHCEYIPYPHTSGVCMKLLNIIIKQANSNSARCTYSGTSLE